MDDDFELTESDVAEIERIEADHRLDKTIIAGHELDRQMALIGGYYGFYSTGWIDAMRLVEKLSSQWGFILRTMHPINGDEARYEAEFFDGDPCICNSVGHVSGFVKFCGRAPTGPLAICRAVFKMQSTKPTGSE